MLSTKVFIDQTHSLVTFKGPENLTTGLQDFDTKGLNRNAYAETSALYYKEFWGLFSDYTQDTVYIWENEPDEEDVQEAIVSVSEWLVSD